MSLNDPLAPLVAEILRLVTGTLLPLILCVMALKISLIPALKGRSGEAILRRRLRALGFPILNDLILEGADGSLTQIDHVALTGRGVLAIETKNYAGMIFGRASDRQWTQVLGRQKIRFQNPLRQNFRHVEAVKRTTGSPVGNLVVFVGGASFPNGMPSGVIAGDELGRYLAGLGLPTEADQHGLAWQSLREAADRSRSMKATHRASLRSRFGRDARVFVGVGCALAAVALFAYFHLGPLR